MKFRKEHIKKLAGSENLNCSSIGQTVAQVQQQTPMQIRSDFGRYSVRSDICIKINNKLVKLFTKLFNVMISTNIAMDTTATLVSPGICKSTQETKITKSI